MMSTSLVKCGAILLLLSFFNNLSAQQWWLGQVHRPDGEAIVFNFEWRKEAGKDVWYIKNAAERIKVDSIRADGDSLFVEMPVFESEFHVRRTGDLLNGLWYKRGAASTQALAFTAARGDKRFGGTSSLPVRNISGRWAVKYEGDSVAGSVAEFEQKGNIVTGTFLNPDGDYRYLEGIVRNDSLLLSCFDGSHAYLFKAAIVNNNMDGMLYAGGRARAHWAAAKDPSAKISGESVAMFLRPGEDSLHFSFRDIDGNTVSISDERFKNKVVVVQLMGSWCPNCMDETKFLSDYYDKNKQRGVEVIALAYEYTTDRDRSVKSIRKFQQRFNVKYPMLITGVAVTDSLRTQKTLPELTDIKVFPSSVIIDKQGKVRKLDTGFMGQATGEHYAEYVKEFESLIDGLLLEN